MTSEIEPSPSWVVHEIVRRAADAPVLVVGGGLTGLSVAKLLDSAGVGVTVVDESNIGDEKRRAFERIEFIDCFVVESEDEAKKQKTFFYEKNFAFAVVSPGISPRSKLIDLITASGITILSELDFAFSFLGFPEVAVTGTNGKSTVVQLITSMLVESAIPAEAVGNIGVPLSAKVEVCDLKSVLDGEKLVARNKPVLVAELSSYQIEWLQLQWSRAAGGQVSIFLNVSDDHLERHGSLENYVFAKARLFALQNESDWAIVNKDDPHSAKVVSVLQGNYMPVGTINNSALLKNYCYVDDTNSQICLEIEGEKTIFDTTVWSLPGYHNRENLAVCIAAASLLGATKEAIVKTYSSFKLLPHRLEAIAVIDDVSFVNDSKGTNVSAVVVALDAMRSKLKGNKQIVLMLGGYLKDGSWDSLKHSLSCVRGIVFFGRDGAKIRDILDLPAGLTQVEAVKMSDAVSKAKGISHPGDIVLLSPGCSSFDSYRNFEERGDDFRRIVEALK